MLTVSVFLWVYVIFSNLAYLFLKNQSPEFCFRGRISAMGQVKLSVFCTFYTIAFASLFIYEAKVRFYTEATFHRCSVE